MRFQKNFLAMACLVCASNAWASSFSGVVKQVEPLGNWCRLSLALDDGRTVELAAAEAVCAKKNEILERRSQFNVKLGTLDGKTVPVATRFSSLGPMNAEEIEKYSRPQSPKEGAACALMELRLWSCDLGARGKAALCQSNVGFGGDLRLIIREQGAQSELSLASLSLEEAARNLGLSTGATLKQVASYRWRRDWLSLSTAPKAGVWSIFSIRYFDQQGLKDYFEGISQSPVDSASNAMVYPCVAPSVAPIDAVQWQRKYKTDPKASFDFPPSAIGADVWNEPSLDVQP
jgi:hypothetical protein